MGERGRQREGLQIAPRKKKTGQWRKGLDHIQGRDYHQTSPTSPNTVSTNQTTKLSHSPTTPNPRRDTPGEKGWVREGDRGKGNTTVKDTLTCALINARSLCNKKEEMVSYVYENTPDMVFVTESWANENTMDSELALNGCVTRRKDRKDRRGGGGLILGERKHNGQ